MKDSQNKTHADRRECQRQMCAFRTELEGWRGIVAVIKGAHSLGRGNGSEGDPDLYPPYYDSEG